MTHQPDGGGAPEAADAPALSGQFFAAVAVIDEEQALRVLERAAGFGLSPERVLLDVIAPAQARVGLEWAAGRFTVAREHAATAISDRAVAVLAGRGSPRSRPAVGHATVACVDGEWHALPARLVAETLRLRGWTVDFLGADVPAAQLVAHLHATGPDVVALSCSLPTRMPAAHATITACQAAGVPVLVGGAGFGPGGRYAGLLGADAWAPTATAAADRLASGRLSSAAVGPSDPLGSLVHLIDQEYTLLSRARRAVVEQTMDALRERLPELGGCTAEELERSREDVVHLVDFLAVALYLDDPRVLTDFLSWTEEVRRAGRLPLAVLPAALEALAAPLRDLPRALGMIRVAGAAGAKPERP
ncbi:cobalamin-binding protein [Streptacidiphilus sp. PB12-B1b]|uniref:cobalamin B12-binding domain-containing protein n=1 Tax=Streptacidiphilus sp. PB12-B1b TaxID=2705012 RepID=UPI0015F85A0F|nr:cobalamin-dependent protein [Streptacidiphilus sp. PB12-B1b]QMU77089.1 cobalamin-binding protein [Streptacidiphilus sp. PB12-B1b]